MLGELPSDFLRVTQAAPNDTDQQYALALDRQLNYSPVGRLNITVDQARLAKNYGITRMDPYVRLRVGHYVYETHTDSNGGKTPRWNKIVQCVLPPGVNSISVEIYDERSFTTDELIAWAQIPIPPTIFSGKTHEEWFLLDGKQGEGLEGTINLVLSYSTAPPAVSPVMVVPGTGTTLMGCSRPYAAVPVYQAPQQPPPPLIQQISEDDLKMVEEMFPNLDKDVIKSVLEVNNGNREATINSLLQMSQ
ncbi:hypothetical protein V9T40_009319 [Parthenolecanium corni]|uniref:Toll-interacting protein n=1 Tax=Parthenolecanium corni TaxID=536013 RepID=A0AAN9Y6M7_9HEMI